MEVILKGVKENQVMVFSGDTDSGKSTQIPQFLLEVWLQNWDIANRRHVEIIFTQPQQLSAIGVAESVGEEQAEKSGNMVTRYD
jgi:HrpA-like RNA helicase